MFRACLSSLLFVLDPDKKVWSPQTRRPGDWPAAVLPAASSSSSDRPPSQQQQVLQRCMLQALQPDDSLLERALRDVDQGTWHIKEANMPVVRVLPMGQGQGNPAQCLMQCASLGHGPPQ
jgi:hypothetical protein